MRSRCPHMPPRVRVPTDSGSIPSSSPTLRLDPIQRAAMILRPWRAATDGPMSHVVHRSSGALGRRVCNTMSRLGHSLIDGKSPRPMRAPQWSLTMTASSNAPWKRFGFGCEPAWRTAAGMTWAILALSVPAHGQPTGQIAGWGYHVVVPLDEVSNLASALLTLHSCWPVGVPVLWPVTVRPT